MTYAEKLKDPRWQKKRLEILNRDDFTCQLCDDNKSTLHVHHRAYANREPWDYPNEWLVTLCESCHQSETQYIDDALQMIGQELRKKFFSKDIASLGFAIESMAMVHLPEVQISAIRWAICQESEMCLLLDRYFAFLVEKNGRDKECCTANA